MVIVITYFEAKMGGQKCFNISNFNRFFTLISQNKRELLAYNFKQQIAEVGFTFFAPQSLTPHNLTGRLALM